MAPEIGSPTFIDGGEMPTRYTCAIEELEFDEQILGDQCLGAAVAERPGDGGQKTGKL
jgi:hypothetical protein